MLDNGVLVRRFESGDMVTLIQKAFQTAGIEMTLAARCSTNAPRYNVQGEELNMKKLMEKADEIRRKNGLEPLCKT